jgi:hypothetical protein
MNEKYEGVGTSANLKEFVESLPKEQMEQNCECAVLFGVFKGEKPGIRKTMVSSATSHDKISEAALRICEIANAVKLDDEMTAKIVGDGKAPRPCLEKSRRSSKKKLREPAKSKRNYKTAKRKEPREGLFFCERRLRRVRKRSS